MRDRGERRHRTTEFDNTEIGRSTQLGAVIGSFRKFGVGGCRCSKRRPGRPKADGRGICKLGERGRIYFWRARDRALRTLCRRYSSVDWDSDEVTNLTTARYPSW